MTRKLIILTCIFLGVSFPQSEWYKSESKNFRLIYKETHSHLVQHILISAETALKPIQQIFDYVPSEKITICTFDIFDYGFASATSVPQNFIRLEIEPFEPGYENVPYNERFLWALSHELIHVAINDEASNFEEITRALFSKVMPEQDQPLTVPFSLLTSSNRYSPRWHQEAPAVFFETWLSGGFGRILGNFDEMFFRSLFLEKKNFPDLLELETLAQKSFLLENLFYLFGGRFSAYLTSVYGSDKFIEWFKTGKSNFYNDFKSKFESVFNTDLDEAWINFIRFEKEFQKQNLNRLKRGIFTPVRRLTNNSFGWVTQPHFNIVNNSVLFGYHKPDQLAAIQKIDINSGKSEDLITLPTPSIYQVSSTAFDKINNLFFYTTNNNMFYRDVWLLDTKTKKNYEIFPNHRIGHLTISPVTRELWGIQHLNASSALFLSAYPYKEIDPVFYFDVGEEILQLSISPSGKYLSSVIHKTDGTQFITLINTESIKNKSGFRYQIISSSGSPENISWSNDENYIFWNAYTNGVSNIYRMNLLTKKIEAVSHIASGLFKPIEISKDSLFAFEFTSEGFIPVIIPNEPAEKLPAIIYLGQTLFDKNPELMNYTLKNSNAALKEDFFKKEYSGLSHLKISTFIPVIAGFQHKKVLGFYTRISDPLLIHDFTLELGYSPFKERSSENEFHLRFKYDFNREFQFEVNYNAADFYDLFNKRKKGISGTHVRLANIHYWVYDNPLKVKQTTDISVYHGLTFFNDNLISVSEPDFIVAQTEYNLQNLRRSIGSSDYESGNEFTATLLGFGSNPENPEFAGQIFADWNNYSTWLFPHNVLLLKLAAGYHNKNSNLIQSQFFFGGFGNRYLENIPVKQYRNTFRFPGIPIYSINTDKFFKIMFENNFPPVWFDNIKIWNHFLSHVDFSVYSQGILINHPIADKWIDAGAQVNFVMKHWYNLESTFSAGIAKAWSFNSQSWEWFLSLKLLKN